MVGIIFKTLGSLLVVFVFFSLVVVKNATSEEGDSGVDTVDKDEDTPGNQVYPPHMWKGVAIWIGVIYAVVNLIAIAMTF